MKLFHIKMSKNVYTYVYVVLSCVLFPNPDKSVILIKIMTTPLCMCQRCVCCQKLSKFSFKVCYGFLIISFDWMKDFSHWILSYDLKLST